jgi:hypothetical protein
MSCGLSIESISVTSILYSQIENRVRVTFLVGSIKIMHVKYSIELNSYRLSMDCSIFNRKGDNKDIDR